MALPTFVLVTGAPGSGKTTLSKRMSDSLRLPLVSRDAIGTGLFHTSGGWTEAPTAVPSTAESIATFFALVEFALGQGVSLIADYVLHQDGFPVECRVPDVASVVVIGTQPGVVGRGEQADAEPGRAEPPSVGGEQEVVLPAGLWPMRRARGRRYGQALLIRS